MAAQRISQKIALIFMVCSYNYRRIPVFRSEGAKAGTIRR